MEKIAAIVVVALGVLAVFVGYALIKPALFIFILTSVGLVGFFYCLQPDVRMRLSFRPILIALALPIMAWAMPTVWLLYLLMGMIVPLLAKRSGDVAPLYLFSLLLLPALDQTIALGSLKLFEFGAHDALVIGAAAAFLVRPEWRGRVHWRLDLPILAVLLLLVSATARDTSITNFFRIFVNTGLDFALPYYVVSRSVRSWDDIRLCMLYIACAGFFISVILIYEMLTSWPLYNTLYDRMGIAAHLLVKLRGGYLRAGGPFLESTSMAMVMVSCILAASNLRSACRSKNHHRVLLLVMLAGLVAPQSRGAWIGLVIGLAVADIFRGEYAKLCRRGLLIGLCGVGLLAAGQMSPYVSETIGMSGGSSESADYRQKLFERGKEEFFKSPFIGYSYPEILSKLSDLKQGEGIIDFVNTYIYIVLISGGMGLSIFLGVFLYYPAKLWFARDRVSRLDADNIDGAAFIFGALVTPIEMLAFTSFGGRPAVFVFIFFALCAGLLSVLPSRDYRRELHAGLPKIGTRAAFNSKPRTQPAAP